MSMFAPLEPSYDDARAYVRGYFPQMLLGNHVQWAMNYIGIEEQLMCEHDTYPRHRMYIVDACVKLLAVKKDERVKDERMSW